MSRTRFPLLEDGDWVRPHPKDYKIACCDCGLVHKLQFKIKKDRVYFRAFRDNRATANVRRARRRRPP